eukprot:TRINITY_DN190_c0_g1_i1.p1 TRINITY_DN190_c0_g1~~TRINITY_DN190_c0_g1_i1.p1  ORF type:complete len:141 (+),score=33.02 TRINITY_DN190_c0_g1_i1:318-740(+)
MLGFSEWQQVGISVTLIGLFFLFFGVIMIFDRALMAFGNLLFVGGIVMLIGFANTFDFFFKRSPLKGTACFVGGVLLVIIKWPIIGMIIEIIGVYFLFGGFFPVITTYLQTFGRNIPVIGFLFRFVNFGQYANNDMDSPV